MGCHSNIFHRKWAFRSFLLCGFVICFAITAFFILLIITPSSNTRYPHNYITFPGVGSYKLHTSGANWSRALFTCMKEGAHLAIINSQQEASALREMMSWQLNNRNYAYLGFHDQKVEGRYTTIFGKPLDWTGFNVWAAGSPLGTTQFNCGCLHSSGKLCDYICNANIPFFCEKFN